MESPATGSFERNLAPAGIEQASHTSAVSAIPDRRTIIPNERLNAADH
jgi:hypothetical protein